MVKLLIDDLVSFIFLEKIGELRLAWVVRLLVQGEQHFAGEREREREREPLCVVLPGGVRTGD